MGWSHVILLPFFTKAADNPSFLTLLALWSDGFFNKYHNKKFQLTDYLGKNMRKITQALSAVCLLFALNCGNKQNCSFLSFRKVKLLTVKQG